MKRRLDPTHDEQKPICYRPIRRALLNRLLIRWGIVLAVGVAFSVLNFVGGQFCDRTEQQIMRGMTIGVYLFIFWKSHVLQRTFAREWVGTVTKRDCQKIIKFDKGPASRKMQWSMVCKWTILKDSTKKKLAIGEEGDVEVLTYDTEEIWEEYFEIGERVRHYKNAKYIVKAHPPRGEENLLCPLCGFLVIQPRCSHCRVTFEEAPENTIEQTADAQMD